MITEKENKILETLGLIRSEFFDMERYMIINVEPNIMNELFGYLRSIDNLFDQLDFCAKQ